MAGSTNRIPNAPRHGVRASVCCSQRHISSLTCSRIFTADNADTVEDTVDLVGTRPFRVEYVDGSAMLRRHRFVYGLDDAIVEEGALIGHVVMDGNLPASHQFEFTALVNLTLRIITE